MTAKRIILVVLSILMGLAGTALTLLVFQTDPEHFAWSNTILMFVAVAGLVSVWLDYFLGTQILKA